MDQKTNQPKTGQVCPPYAAPSSNNNKWWGLGALAVILVGYLVLSQQPAVAPTPTGNQNLLGDVITIGAIYPLTGDAAMVGLPLQKATELAVEHINAGSGKKVKVMYEDGKCNGQDAATAVQKLINVDRVMAIIGGACSGETLGLAPIANEKKIIVISPSATSPDITSKGGPYVYRFAPSDALAGKVAAAYALNDMDFKRAAVISENTDYAQGLRKTFITSFKLLGGEIAVDEVYDTGVTDFGTQASKIKSAGVDVVYILPQSPTPGLAILKALSDQQVSARRMTAEAFLSREAAKENAALMEGLVGFEPFFQEEAPAAQEFIRTYKEKYKEDLAYPFFMSNAYSEVFLLKELIEKHEGDIEKVRDELDRLQNWSGGSVAGVNLDQSGDIQWRTYGVKEVRGGAIESVRTFTLE